jgi:hypothetical protein
MTGSIGHDELTRRFSPSPDASTEVILIYRAAFGLATIVSQLCPPGRETSLALTNLEETVFWAAAACDRRTPEQGAQPQVGR